jgi:23S rRNA pseudouridine1911/1915/1917 synthase
MNQFTASERARLDQIIAKHFSVSVSLAKQFIEEGKVKISGRTARKGDLIEPGQLISTEGEPSRLDGFVIIPQPELSLSIVYEDDSLVAIEKPSGIPTHPLAPNEQNTLANALAARFPMCAQSSDDPRECGIAHRLDIETSGLLLAAKDKDSFRALRRMFSEHRVTKTYLALVSGVIPEPTEISAMIGHDPKNQKKAVVMPEGRLAKRHHALEALTQIEPRKSNDDATLISAKTIFGRMHQVRVHLAHLGHPLLGDALYGGPPQTLFARSFFLHAHSLRFIHPVSQKELQLQTEDPQEIVDLSW